MTSVCVQATSSTATMQQMPTPFDSAAMEGHPPAASSGVHDSGVSEGRPVEENRIQQRAQTWARQRQQERSVLSQHDSTELEPVTRTQSSLTEMAGSGVRSNALHPSSHVAHDWMSHHQSPRRLSRRQSEPSRSIDDEWPALGTPPVTLHLPPLTPPRHPPLPSPVNPSHRSAGQHPPGTQAAVGFGWAANLARGAEWMGEATGLRFLTRPFSRTVAGMTGFSMSAAATDQTAASSHSHVATSSSRSQGLADADMQTLERVPSLSQPVSGSAPSNGSTSYRERLLAGSAASSSGQANGQSMLRVSPSKQPPQGSQIGFPTQQELQASHSSAAHQSSSPSSTSANTSASAAVAVPSSSAPTIPIVSALSLGRASLDAQSQRPQSQSQAGSTTPTEHRSSADCTQGSSTDAPPAVPVLSEAATVPPHDEGAHSAVGTQTGVQIGTHLGTQPSPGPGGLGFTTWPPQLAADSQGDCTCTHCWHGWDLAKCKAFIMHA